jgi:hypothetical protein
MGAFPRSLTFSLGQKEQPPATLIFHENRGTESLVGRVKARK